MARPREWFTVTLPNIFSAWLLGAYRQPLRFLLLLVMVPLVSVLLATYRINVGLASQRALHNLRVTAHLSAEIITQTFGDTLLYEQMIASQPAFVEAVAQRDVETIGRLIQQSFGFVSEVDQVTVVDPTGRILAVYPANPRMVGRDVSTEDVFTGAQEGGWHEYISAVYLREAAWTEKVVGIVLPVTREGHVIGLLAAQHRVEAVKSWLQTIRVDPGGFVYVVDHRNQLVAYPFQVLPGQPKIVSDWPTVAYPLSAEGGTLTFTHPRTRDVWLAGIYPVGDTGWRVVAVQPEHAVRGSLHKIFMPLSLLVVFLFVIVIAVSFRWAQIQAFSLRLLRQNAKLLKQLQQRRLFERGPPGLGPGGKTGAA